MRPTEPPADADLRSRIRLRLVVYGVILTVMAFWLHRTRQAAIQPPPARPAATNDAAFHAAVLALDNAERAAAVRYWGPEFTARRHGVVIERLWDGLNAAPAALEAMAAWPVGGVTLPEWGGPVAVGQGIVEHAPAGGARVDDFATVVRSRIALGWRLDRSEWRHIGFAAGPPARSTVELALEFSRTNAGERVSLTGPLIITWSVAGAEGAEPEMADADASRLVLHRRAGPPPFREIAFKVLGPLARTHWIDPLIVEDLDQDGAPEILLAARNLLFRHTGGGGYAEEPLAPHHPGLLFTSLLADFNADGRPDLLCAVRAGLVLLPGTEGGRFDAPAAAGWSAPARLAYVQALTAGDADGDGDLDVFLGQYRVPYVGGQMPTPFFDANDGEPAYFLRNRGDGTFEDVIAAAGLEAKRRRRSYSASFADLDGDRDLDLVVVSDFAGADLYANDGRGRFTDVTAEWLDDPRAFGMAHALADFDADGREDLLLVGMNSATADRLSALGLNRPGPAGEDWAEERRRVTFGNRLFFGAAGGFRQRPAGAALARGGWAWGVGVFDADNDGFPDLYLANGHETRAATADYESEFWLHDIHAGTSRADPVVGGYFAAGFARTRAAGWSYGGWDRNRLFVNRGGTNFLDAAHLLGVALQADARNVVAADLDGDGRCELLVTTFEDWPQRRQTLRIWRNEGVDVGGWIGFRLRDARGAPAPPGTVVEITTARGTTRRQLVLGDSYRSQHPAAVHFGLGAGNAVLRAEVSWPDGRRTALDRPPAGVWHAVQAPR
ncbi:MAG: FG-GAP-like repeat-containing protein [Limisphaerales bacterium]